MKVMEKQYAWQKNILNLKKITDESEAGLNFSSNRPKHTMPENTVVKYASYMYVS